MDSPLHLPGQLREHLRALRKARGLTQAGLGELLGVGQARIAEIESNPGVVSLDQLMKVLSALRAVLVLRDEAADPVVPHRTTTTRAQAQEPDQATYGSAPQKPKAGFVIPPKKGSW